MEDFEAELKASFLEEAEQLLTEVEKSYLDLETNPNDSAILDQIFRVAHNLKGSAKAVGFNQVGQFAHQFENLLLKLKNQELQINPSIVNLLLKSNDHLCNMVQQLKVAGDSTFDSSELLSDISSILNGAPANKSEPTSTNQIYEGEGTDVELNLIEEITENEEANPAQIQNDVFESPNLIELNSEKPTPIDVNAATTPKTPVHSPASGEESIRVSLARLEKLINYVGEMVILQTVLNEQAQSSNDLLRKTVLQLGKVTKEVQEISMSLRMVPLKATFQKMQRIVRDTSMELKKSVSLQLSGEETELDKTILEQVNDPLVHLIRNACDHGIESNELRRERQKPEQGTIRLSASHQNGKLVIEVADDGGGINPDTLRKKAIERKIISENTKLSDQEAINLIFHPGFSTKAVVTDVSGRGVGMDVVKTNIEALEGDVLVETQLFKGSTFKIILPLTLAIIDAMVVTICDSRYVIPLSHVQESVKLDPTDIKHTTGLGDLLLLRGETIPLFRLSSLLGRKSTSLARAEMIALVIYGKLENFAVLVDDIVGQYQVVIKQLGNELQHIRGFSGSSILGDGKPALILELAELVARTKNQSSQQPRGVAA